MTTIDYAMLGALAMLALAAMAFGLPYWFIQRTRETRPRRAYSAVYYGGDDDQ